jgi:hypothetical protein
MIVQQNNMTFDDSDERCQLILCESNANIVNYAVAAFITVVDDSTQACKRYWGMYDINHPEASIRRIMDVGGKWPIPFRNLPLRSGELYE